MYKLTRLAGFNVPLLSIVSVLAVGALLLLAGCKKSGQQAKSDAQPPAQSQSPAQSRPAAESSGGGATAGTTAVSPAAADTTARLAGAEWATRQDEIKHDPQGQWAIQGTASSTYNDAQGETGWSANQAAGPPNVEHYADDGKAWAPKTADSGIEWLDLKYAKPVHATEVRVRESCGSGAVIKVELFDEQGVAHPVWAGSDPTTDLNYLIVKFPKTGFATARVKVTLATNIVPGWNEIDAVQLVGVDQYGARQPPISAVTETLLKRARAARLP